MNSFAFYITCSSKRYRDDGCSMGMLLYEPAMSIPSFTCCKPVILLYTVYTMDALAAEIVSRNEKTDDDSSICSVARVADIILLRRLPIHQGFR